MASRFVEVTEWEKAVDYAHMGLLVGVTITVCGPCYDDAEWWTRTNEKWWAIRRNKYGILVEDDSEEPSRG